MIRNVSRTPTTRMDHESSRNSYYVQSGAAAGAGVVAATEGSVTGAVVGAGTSAVSAGMGINENVQAHRLPAEDSGNSSKASQSNAGDVQFPDCSDFSKGADYVEHSSSNDSFLSPGDQFSIANCGNPGMSLIRHRSTQGDSYDRSVQDCYRVSMGFEPLRETEYDRQSSDCVIS